MEVWFQKRKLTESKCDVLKIKCYTFSRFDWGALKGRVNQGLVCNLTPDFQYMWMEKPLKGQNSLASLQIP